MTTGMVYAHMTAYVVRFNDDGEGYTIQSGWVDPSWSRHELFASRNDVRPIFSAWDDDPNLPDMIADALAELGPHHTDNSDGTFYTIDSDVNHPDGSGWSYAVHFTIRGADHRERPYIP